MHDDEVVVGKASAVLQDAPFGDLETKTLHSEALF